MAAASLVAEGIPCVLIGAVPPPLEWLASNSDELVPGFCATPSVFWMGSVVEVFVIRMLRP
eukprot:89814-Pelagomonas_calceolata.AAC.1